MTLNELITMSWTWRGPIEVRDGDTVHYEMRIEELPDFFVAGQSAEEVLDEAKPALETFLTSYLERNETPPMPGHTRWIFLAPPKAPAIRTPAVEAPATKRQPRSVASARPVGLVPA